MKIAASLFVLAITLPSALATLEGKAPEFPLREKYPLLPTISTEDLLALENPVVIDARNAVEYDVIHVDGALNQLVGDMEKKFLDGVRKHHPDAPIVFYCNGVTCSKSYKAGEKARVWGFDNFFVYDAGIFAFAETAPERAVFFGEALDAKSVGEKLISKEELEKSCKPPAEFIELMRSGDWRIYDVRDKTERQEAPIKVGKMAKVTMDEFVSFLDRGAVPKSKILIFDNVGKQVRWLQYYLEKAGVTNYVFLDGGVGAWLDAGLDERGEKVVHAAAK
jgi:rhodanese-related sulfurtransferase